MERIAKSLLIIVVLLVAIFAGFAQQMVFAQPGVLPTVRLTGTVYAPHTKGLEGGLAIMRILMGKTECVFKITNAQDVFNQEITGMELLDNLDDQLELKEGSKGILAPLQKPDAAGKTVTIEGILDEATGFMEVTKVTIENGQ